jgi:hypothetical protein
MGWNEWQTTFATACTTYSVLVRILAEAEMQGYREEKRKLMQLPTLYLFGTKLLPDE